MSSLPEKYRPRTWADVKFQDKALRVLGRIAGGDGFGGRAVWLAGGTGTGKTTIARLIAAEVADPLNQHELDAPLLTPAMLRDIAEDGHYLAMGEKPGRCYTVNEADRLSAAARGQLKTVLESIPESTTWVFTTTLQRGGSQGDLFGGKSECAQVVDRCLEINLTPLDANRAGEIAPWLLDIARREGLDGRPVGDYENLWRQVCRETSEEIRHVSPCGSLRAALAKIEAGVML